MPFARIAYYTMKPGMIDTVLRKGEAELLPLTRQQPGFRSYTVFRTSPDSGISITGWESEEQANEAADRLGGWMRTEFGPSLLSAESHVGDVTLFHGAHTGPPAFGRVSFWQAKPGSVPPLMPRLEAEYVPLLARQPGFVRCAIVQTSDHSTVSLSVFGTREQLHAAVDQVSPWIQEHVMPLAIAVERHEGDMVWSVWAD
jgi:heme-degrading monooxygenase HmoA